jgi:hypothetical protein
VDADGTIDRGATVNEHVVVGPHATIETGARVSDTVLHERAVVEPDAVVERSVLGLIDRDAGWFRSATPCSLGGGVGAARRAATVACDRVKGRGVTFEHARNVVIRCGPPDHPHRTHA